MLGTQGLKAGSGRAGASGFSRRRPLLLLQPGSLAGWAVGMCVCPGAAGAGTWHADRPQSFAGWELCSRVSTERRTTECQSWKAAEAGESTFSLSHRALRPRREGSHRAQQRTRTSVLALRLRTRALGPGAPSSVPQAAGSTCFPAGPMAPGRRQPGAWRCPGLRTGSHGSSRERWRRWRERRLEGGFGGQGVKSRGASEATRVATEDWASGEHWKSGPCLVWTPEPGSFKNLWPGPGPLGLRARGGDRFRDTQTEVRCGELRPHAPRPLRQGRGFLGSGRCSAESLALSPHGTDAIPELGRRTRLRGTLLPVLAGPRCPCRSPPDRQCGIQRFQWPYER